MCDVFESSITAIAIKPVRKARRLADVEIIQTVVVDIAGGQSIVSVDFDAASSVQNCAPMVDSAEHLVPVRFDVTECLLADVDEDRFARAAESFLGRLPENNSPLPGLVQSPLRAPLTDALFARTIFPAADQIVANVDP